MADDNSARYRSNESFGRGPAAPATDPLAELARLIGQNDPFSESGRTARTVASVDRSVRAVAAAAVCAAARPASRPHGLRHHAEFRQPALHRAARPAGAGRL